MSLLEPETQGELISALFWMGDKTVAVHLWFLKRRYSLHGQRKCDDRVSNDTNEVKFHNEVWKINYMYQHGS